MTYIVAYIKSMSSNLTSLSDKKALLLLGKLLDQTSKVISITQPQPWSTFLFNSQCDESKPKPKPSLSHLGWTPIYSVYPKENRLCHYTYWVEPILLSWKKKNWNKKNFIKANYGPSKCVSGRLFFRKCTKHISLQGRKQVPMTMF